MQVNVINENNVEVSIDPPQTIVVEVDQGKQGRGITNISYQQEGEYYYLVVTYTDGTTEQLGPLVITGAAVSLLGGTAGAIAYQTAPDNTGFIALGAQNQVLVAGSTAPEYTSSLTGLTVNNSAIGNTTPSTGAFTNLSASGAFSITGDQVQISEGGTGQTTANAAFNALAPSQTGNSGKYLKTDGTNTSWDQLDISTADITGTLAVTNGGTGATNAADARTNLNAASQSTTISAGTGLTGGGDLSANRTLNIANTTVTAGAYGSASDTLTATVNAQGQLTAIAATPIAIANTQISGLGTMSTQNANSVSITGGSITGITDLAIADGGTGASTAADARANLGLGSAAVLNAGVANGVATLDSGGTVPLSQLPASIQGGVSYQGSWDAATNTPTLTSSVGSKGYYYVVSVAGSTNLNGVTDWLPGDWAIFNGSVWQKIDNTDAVASVNGYTGVVVLSAADVGAPPTSRTISAGTGLTGGGDLSTNRTISIANTAVSAGSYGSASSVGTFTVNGQGQLTAAASTPIAITNTQVSGLGTMSTQNANSVSITGGSITGITDLAVADGGTGASDAASARTNLGAAASGANSDITSLSGITGAIGTADYVAFDTTYATTLAAGQLGWDGNNTLGLGMAGGNVVQKIGEDQFYYIKASSAITKGQVVMFTGSVGASGVVTGAPATGITDGSYIMGIAAETIALNGFGLVQFEGTLRGIDTSAFTDGAILWYNPAVTGGLTATQPSAPNVKVQMAAVINAASGGSGSVLIRVASGSVLGGTDSNVQFSTLVNGNIIQYDSSLGYWKNVAPSSVSVTTFSGGTTGLTPATATAGAVTLGGTLAIANGGTGQTTANAAFNALAPSQTGNSGKYLTTDGTNTSWATNPLGTVTSVSGTGTVSGITLSGTVTTSGSLTLGGSLDLSAYNGAGAFTTLSASSTVTLSGGTANGVAYLNGSKVVTTGSALTFDGAVFSIYGGANGSRFAVKGTGAFAGFDTGATTDGRVEYAYNGANIFYTGMDSASLMTLMARSGVSLAFGANGSEQMRLTSTGLGIGTSSPTANLEVKNPTGAANLKVSDGGTPANTVWIGNRPFGSTVAGIYTDGASSFAIGTNSTERLRIDTSGNLGLGVTPSAGAVWVNFQTQRATLTGGANDRSESAYNAYRTSGQYTYIGSDYASIYQQTAGQHRWFTAPSGTAGNAISFTQAMTLDASGNLGVGTTSPGSKLQVLGPVASINDGTGSVRIETDAAGTDVLNALGAGIVFAQRWQAASGTVRVAGVYGVKGFSSSNFGGALAFYTQPANGSDMSERARIDSSGNLLVGLTSATGTAKLQVSGPLRTTGYTVATLPAGTVGMRTYVTDALAPSFGATVVGGGAVTIPVFYNGTNWIVG